MSEWQPIETAPKSWLSVIIAGRYANGTPYVEKSYWDPRGHWSARKLEPPTHWMPFPEPPTPNDGWTPGREITNAQLEAACAAYLAHGQPGADPQAAWDMLGEQYKPAIRARIRDVLRAGSGA